MIFPKTTLSLSGERFTVLYRLVAGDETQAQAVARRIFPDPDSAPLRQMLVETISQADPRAYRRAMTSLGLYNSVKRLGEIKAATLVVTGGDDTTVSPLRQLLLVKGIPAARQVLIPDAGHAVPDTGGNRFLKRSVLHGRGFRFPDQERDFAFDGVALREQFADFRGGAA